MRSAIWGLVAVVMVGTLAGRARGQAFDQCGTYMNGLEGCVLFQPDDMSGSVNAGPPPAPFQVGDRARVRGMLVACTGFCFVQCVSSPVVTACGGGVCRADFDGNGTLETADIFAFLNAWFALSPSADFDQSGGLATADIFAFLDEWFTGC